VKGRAERSATSFVVGFGLMAGWFGLTAYLPGVATAMHEIDHRFIVEGHVCGADGKPVPDTKVIVRDPRVTGGVAEFTDSRGYYKATLHLHNENRGDTILVEALDQEQKGTALFDTKDMKTERKITVNFGTGCATSAEDETPVWVYGAGLGLAAVAAFAGVKWMRKSRRASQKRGKGQRK
jgi:MYXO-CTERM domain-containing protein